MVHTGCVFIAGIQPSKTWMSGSFESVRWNACVHRLDLGLYTPREKSPLPEKKFFSEEDRTHDAASSSSSIKLKSYKMRTTLLA